MNSAASGVSKIGNLFYSTPKSAVPEPQQPETPLQLPQPEQPPPPQPAQAGGRRRTRRR